MSNLKAGLPPLPPKMAGVPIDDRGFPVPWFVQWINGKPDHRVMDSRKLPLAVKHGLCWQCGGPLGRYKSFVIGPMCSITGTIAEPPSHLECARYACTACPFITRPHAKRREVTHPAVVDQAGFPILRNPGCIAVWTTTTYKAYRTGRGGAPGNDGILFRFGPPESIEWYAEGRPATRAEVDASIASGFHVLQEQADAQDAEEGGDGARQELARLADISRQLLDAQIWPNEPQAAEEA